MKDIPRTVSWQEIEILLSRIARELQPKKQNIQQIFGIPRGGTILAVMLSHHLNLPIIYDDKLIDEHTLIVDDAIITGNTFKELLLEKKCCGVLLYISQQALADKELSSYPLLWTGMPKKDKEWLTFPWEKH